MLRSSPRADSGILKIGVLGVWAQERWSEVAWCLLPQPQSPHLYDGDHALCTSERLGEIKVVILMVKGLSPGRPAQVPGVTQPFPARLEPAVQAEQLASVPVMVMPAPYGAFVSPFRPVRSMSCPLWQGKMGPECYSGAWQAWRCDLGQIFSPLAHL